MPKLHKLRVDDLTTHFWNKQVIAALEFIVNCGHFKKEALIT